MKSRAYRQSARAVATEETRTAILDAVDAIFSPAPGGAFSLDDVAQRAGTTVQTVIRHYGTKGRLIEAAARRARGNIRTERDAVPPNDIAAVAAYLARHYEEDAPLMLRMLAVEHAFPEIGRIVRAGRKLHREFVARVFEERLLRAKPKDRPRLTATLVAVTDLLAWKVLRLEQGLRRGDYERAIRDLLEALS